MIPWPPPKWDEEEELACPCRGETSRRIDRDHSLTDWTVPQRFSSKQWVVPQSPWRWQIGLLTKQFWSIFPGCRRVRHCWTTALWVCYFAVCGPHYIKHSGIQWRNRISPLQQDHCLQSEQMQSLECNALSVMRRCVCQLSANCDKKVHHFVRKLVTVVGSIHTAQNFCPYTSSWFNETSSGTYVYVSILSSSNNYIRYINKSINSSNSMTFITTFTKLGYLVCILSMSIMLTFQSHATGKNTNVTYKIYLKKYEYFF